MEVIWFIVAIAAYLLPAIIAGQRGHPSHTAIAVLNIVLGWTLIGWFLALIWSLTGPGKPAPAIIQDTHVKCPDCAELVLADARVCKHCGCKLIPDSQQNQTP